ncbi:MAG: hypothetical protein ABI432_04180, partial [Flavobacteriales bacterium]
SWKAGLKTGMYYLRTKAATDAIKFTVDKAKLTQPATQEAPALSGVEGGRGNGVPVGSTVVLEPVHSGPTTTRVASPVAARVTTNASEGGHSERSEGNDLPMSAVEMQNAERMNALSKQAQAQAEISCSLDDPEGCEMCSG